MTLWVFSPDNLLRPPKEVSGIFAAIESKLAALTHDPQIHSRRVRVRTANGHLIKKAHSARRASQRTERVFFFDQKKWSFLSTRRPSLRSQRGQLMLYSHPLASCQGVASSTQSTEKYGVQTIAHVAFMSHGAAVSHCKSLEMPENVLHHAASKNPPTTEPAEA